MPKTRYHCAMFLLGLIGCILIGVVLGFCISAFFWVGRARKPMPKIMIRCPIKRRAVPTGLTTEMIVFDSLDADLEMSLKCPACLKTHKWKPTETWIDKAELS